MLPAARRAWRRLGSKGRASRLGIAWERCQAITAGEEWVEVILSPARAAAGSENSPLTSPSAGEGTRRPPGVREKAGEGARGRRGWSRVRASPWGWGGSPPTPPRFLPRVWDSPSNRMVFPRLAAVARAEFGRSQPGRDGDGVTRGSWRPMGGPPPPPHPDPSPGDPPRYSRAQEAKAGRLIGAAGGRALWFAGVTVPGMTGWGMSHPPLGEVACACVCEWGFACAIDSFVTGTDGLFWGFSPRGSPAPR